MRTVLLLLSGLLCVAGHSATYFVDPGTGNDTNHGQSQSSPWAHLPGTVSGGPSTIINNGDVIYVKGGTVNNVSVNFDGISHGGNYNGAAAFDSVQVISGDQISWGAGRAVIDGQNTRFYGVGFSAAASGVTLNGFEIRNIAAAANSGLFGNGSACIELGSSYATIRRCYLHDALRAGEDQGHGIEGVQSGNHFIITQNTIGPNIGTKGIEPYGMPFGVISNNFISGTGDHCIALTRCTNVDVCNNLINQIGSPVHQPTYCISGSEHFRCEIWNNVMFDTYSGAESSGGLGVYAADVTTDNHYYHNTLYRLTEIGNGGASSAISIGGQPTVVNSTLQNNLVVNCTNSVGPNGFMVFVNNQSGTVLNFNDFWGGAAGITVCGQNNSGTYSYSTVAGFSASGVTFQNNLQLDPVFTGGSLPSGLDASFHPNTTFFALTTSSPQTVTNTGNILLGATGWGFNQSQGKFGLDIIGTSRTVWSMGAYEQGSSAVGVAPSISVQPAGQNIQVSQQISLSVMASGTAPLAYQWKLGGTAILGATASTYVKSNAQVSDTGNYTVVITNLSGTVTSSTAVVNVTNAAVALIAVNASRLNFGIVPTNTVTTLPFVISNVGSNGSVLNGTASVSAPFAVVAPPSGNYSLAFGTSTNIAITYTPTAVGSNNATVTLTGGGGTNVSVLGLAYPIMPTGALNPAAGATQPPLYAVNGSVLITSNAPIKGINYASGYSIFGFNLPIAWTNAFLSAFVEATNTSDTAAWVAIDAMPLDPANIWDITNANGFASYTVGWRGPPQIRTNFWSLAAGNHYIALYPVLQNQRYSNFVLSPFFGYPLPPQILVQPQSQNILLGTPVAFSVVASGTAPLTYQWNFNGMAIIGANQSSYSINYPLAPNQGLYSCTVTNVAGSITSFAANLSEYLPLGTIPSNSVIVIRGPNQ